MVRLDENQVTQKLVDFCNENSTFMKCFISLFTEKENVKRIEFTGENETGNGKPDITITFKDDSIYLIEVKTRVSTEFSENQVTSKSGYAKIIKEHKQKLSESMGYLLDPQHDTEKCIKDTKIIKWNDVFNLIRDFNNQSLAYDISNGVDDIDIGGGVMGSDNELFDNPYLLAMYGDVILKKEPNTKANFWIYSDYLIPALEECTKDIRQFSHGGLAYTGCVYGKEALHITLFSTYSNTSGKWYGYFSFTFYRPWIVGIRTATNNAQMVEMTKRAVKLWLFDYEKNVKNADTHLDLDFDGNYSKSYFESYTELYGNPYLFAQTIDYLKDGKDIYDDIVIPALKSFEYITIKKRNDLRYDNNDESERRYIHIQYNDIDIWFNIYEFRSSKTDDFVTNHSFIFYRPWIMGIRLTDDKKQIIEYTRQALELWFEDLKADEYI